jgi:hypothetical protein
MPRFFSLACALLLAAPPARACDPPLATIRVADDGRSFVRSDDGAAFVPRGFNYDHDHDGRLIEDYWHQEWATVEEDFREMRALGANLVRIHLQFGRFMAAPDEPVERELAQLERLLELAERERLYLDLTGLGCYHKADVPAWYDDLDETGRWAAQARFWEAVAGRCRQSPAVFCYDLMNEPVVPGGQRAPRDWLGPAFAGKHFVQCITLDQAERKRPDIARQWIETLAAAVRRQDDRHLVTVGLVDWSLDRPGLTSGFVPAEVTGPLDFVAVHVYPQKGKVAEALETLRGFDVGKPVLIEETFPLACGLEEFEEFLTDAREHSAGFVSFYWGRTPEELRAGGTLPEAITAEYLEWFQK